MQTFYEPPVRSATGTIPQAQRPVPSGLHAGLRAAASHDLTQAQREPTFSAAADEAGIWEALLHASNPSGYERLGANVDDPGLVPLGVPQPDNGQSGTSARGRPADWTVEEGWGLNELVAQRRKPIVSAPNPYYRNGYWRPWGEPVAQIRYPLLTGATGHTQEHLAALRLIQLHGLVYEQPPTTILNDNLASSAAPMMTTRANVLPTVVDAY